MRGPLAVDGSCERFIVTSFQRKNSFCSAFESTFVSTRDESFSLKDSKRANYIVDLQKECQVLKEIGHLSFHLPAPAFLPTFQAQILSTN